MRNIDTIFLHCSATPPSMDLTAATVREWHTSSPRNWSDIGYHFFIRRDGLVESGRDLDKIGAHVKGANRGSVAICYAGGVDEDGDPCNNMNAIQRAAIVRIVRSLRIVLNTPLTLRGHNDDPNTNKACPSFRVDEEFSDLVAWLAVYDAKTGH